MRRALIIAVVLLVASMSALAWGLVMVEAPGTVTIKGSLGVYGTPDDPVVRPRDAPYYQGIVLMSVSVRRRGLYVAVADEVNWNVSVITDAPEDVITPAARALIREQSVRALAQAVRAGDTTLVSMSRPVTPREADVLFRKPGLVPRASGIALVVGAAGLFPMTLYALWFARSLARRLHGLCGACGYALAGVPRCPECGASSRILEHRRVQSRCS